MTIPKLTPYTGQVANPDGSQTQTEFTQNMFDQLSYEAQLATQLDATIDGMNNAVDEVEANAVSAENSANAAEAAASSAGYQGLWPDTGGSALKGEVWQTQVGGTPTGEYFIALQDTSSDPVNDNVNWKAQNNHATLTNRDAVGAHQASAISYDEESSEDFMEGLRLSNASILSNICRKDGANIVITGDSLSYNHQDFDPTPRGTAQSCHVGMRSWSFMLRDIIHKQDQWFKSFDEFELGYVRESSLVSYNSASTPQIFPFGGRIATLSALPAENEVFTFQYKHSGESDTAYLVLIGDPSGLSCTYSVTVDGGSQVNSTTKVSTADFQGRRLIFLPLSVPNDGKLHTLRIYNFAQAADSPDASGRCQLNLVGMTSKYTNVHLTGVGGFSAGDLLTQWDSRAVNKNPDALIMIVGANDAYDGDSVETYKANLLQLINRVKEVKPHCEFLLMSTPGTNQDSAFSVPDETSKRLNAAMKQFCSENRCHFFDIYNFFDSTDRENFRYDHIHFNRDGNAALCRSLCTLIGLEKSVEDTEPNYSLVSQQIVQNPKYTGSSIIANPSTSLPHDYVVGDKTGSLGVVKSATSTDGVVVRVTFREKLESLNSVTISSWDFNSEKLTPVIVGYGDDWVEFKVVRADGLSTVTTSDYSGLRTDLNFLVSY